MNTTNGYELVSDRARRLMGSPPKIVIGHFRCAEDPFDPIENPHGHLNFGTAENFLLDDFVLKKIQQFQYNDSKYNHYGPLHGLNSTKLAFAKFLEHFFSVSNINIENLLIGNGGTGILEMISFSLLNSGDKMLIPAPYYSGFDLDFNTRFGVELVPWQIKNSDFDFSQKLIDEIASGKYRAFMLNNPHNPLAQNFSEQMVKTIAQTCIAHNVHLISDEVYAHSIVNPGRPFHSVIPYMGPKNPVHFVYSVAKDFGLSGFKTGFFYSEHRASVQAMKNVSYFYPVSNYTQKLLEFIFEDLAWIELLKQHNQELLGQAYQHLRTYVLDPLNAAHNSVEQGIFAYVDLTQLASKIKAPNAEIFYDRLLNEIKTNMTPGIYFHDNHPWRFRVCFAKPQSHIQELGRRLRHWS